MTFKNWSPNFRSNSPDMDSTRFGAEGEWCFVWGPSENVAEPAQKGALEK